MNRKRAIRVLVACLVGLVAAGALLWWQADRMAQGPDRTVGRFDVSGLDIGGGFSLIGDGGARVTNQDFDADLFLIYFGYTFCPDVCPTELSKIAQTMDLLGDDGARAQPVFITIDPERDTPEALAQYVTLFHPRLVGLTGSAEEIAAIAEAYRVYYRRVEPEDSTYYLMDHSSFIYLTDHEGQLLYLLGPDKTPEDIAEIVRTFLDRESG